MKNTSVCFRFVCSLALFALNIGFANAQGSNPFFPEPVWATSTHVLGAGQPIDARFSIEEFIGIQVASLDSIEKYKKVGLFLWIDGVCFPNLKLKQVDYAHRIVYFQLDRDTAKSSPWHMLYAYDYYFTYDKQANVSIGTATRNLTTPLRIVLYTSEWWMLLVGSAGILVFICLVFVLSKRMLRDALPVAPDTKYKILYWRKSEPLLPEEVYYFDIPYSLSRAQLVFWNALVVIAIIYIWMFTDELVAPSATVLTLIGISGGTNVIGRIIDNDKKRGRSDAPATPPVTVEGWKQSGTKSNGFFTDILSDGNGISIHRFQLVTFTAVLGIYFVWWMIYSLSMPDFSQTLLLLMGISSTTYAGVKITE